MSYGDQSRLQKALNDLQNVTKGTLQFHRSEYALVFRKLEALVEDPSISQGESLQSIEYQRLSLTYPGYDRASFSGMNGAETPPPFDTQTSSTSTVQPGSAATHKLTNGHGTSIPSSISSLAKALDDDSSKITNFLLGLQFKTAGDELISTLEDPRTVDLQLETQRPSLETKFRNGLCLRSLALDFNDWEIGYNPRWQPRITATVGKLSKSRRDGHVTQYLRSGTHRFANLKTMKVGIQHGIKMLVVDRLLENKAISLILCLKSRRFYSVRFGDLETLVKIIKQKEWIAALLQQKADWFEDCQRKYNGT